MLSIATTVGCGHFALPRIAYSAELLPRVSLDQLRYFMTVLRTEVPIGSLHLELSKPDGEPSQGSGRGASAGDSHLGSR